MDRHTLFLLAPGFFDGEDGPYFCPHSAAMEGMLVYVPDLASHIDVRRIPFVRPRPAIVELLGAEHQGTPVLVLKDGTDVPEEAQVSEETGRAFLSGEMAIGRYLSQELGVMQPH
jgi:hypothetical protein